MVIKREELYKQVWSKPIVRLAEEYGISDVALHKICRKLNVPSPQIGYWRKIEVGQIVEKKPLPPLQTGAVAEHKITEYNPRYLSKIPENAREMFNCLNNGTLSYNISDSLKGAHYLVTNTAIVLKSSEVYQGILYPGHMYHDTREILKVRVSLSQLERALKIMDTLIKFLELLNFPVSVREGRTFARVFEEDIEIVLKEKVVRKIVKQRKSILESAEYDYIPTSRLSLNITGIHTDELIRKNFPKNGSLKLEEQIGDFVAALITASFSIKARNQYFEEERKKKMEEERKRAEINKELDRENEMVRQLNTIIHEYNYCKKIRQFIKDYESNLSALCCSSSELKKIKEWINWCKKYSDSIDPLRRIISS